jgi:transcriptional regulator with XRE-family HTH domain
MPHPSFDAFGPRLKYWRELRGFKKQGSFAEKLGIKQGSLSELESGESKAPSADVLLKMADLLQLRPRYLLLGEGAPENRNFSDLNGLEAQLVMIFRQLPNDTLRDGLLIDANDMLNRTAQGALTSANPFPETPAPPKLVPGKHLIPAAESNPNESLDLRRAKDQKDGRVAGARQRAGQKR